MDNLESKSINIVNTNKWLLIIPLTFTLSVIYGQGKQFAIQKTDTIFFINYNEKDLSVLKKVRLLEARQQNKISDTWDLDQFYGMKKWGGRDLDRLNKELKKAKINYIFLSTSDTLTNHSLFKRKISMTTDFEVKESENHKYLIITMISKLQDADSNLIMDGIAWEIIKSLKNDK